MAELDSSAASEVQPDGGAGSTVAIRGSVAASAGETVGLNQLEIALILSRPKFGGIATLKLLSSSPSEILTRAMRSRLQLCAEGRRRDQLALGQRRQLHAATARRAACRCKAADSSSRSAVPAIGIDLGTTSSAIAVVGPDGRPHIVHDAQGPAVVPSVVHFAQVGVHMPMTGIPSYLELQAT